MLSSAFLLFAGVGMWELPIKFLSHSFYKMEKQEVISLFENLKTNVKENVDLEFIENWDLTPENAYALAGWQERKIKINWQKAKDLDYETTEKILCHELGHFIHYFYNKNKIEKEAEKIKRNVEKVFNVGIKKIERLINELKDEEVREQLAKEIGGCIYEEIS